MRKEIMQKLFACISLAPQFSVGFFVPLISKGYIMKKKVAFSERKVLRLITGVGIFSALAFGVAYVCKMFIPPVSGFLSIEVKDAIIAIASFVYGPIVAPIISLVVAFMEAIIPPPTGEPTGWYGFVMNFVSSATFSLTVSLIYKMKKNVNYALIGFLCAICSTTAMMMLMNAFVTPLYVKQVGFPFDVVHHLPILFLPFNFAKTLLNSSVAMMLYKPIINALRAARLVPRSEYKTKFNKSSIIILSVGTVLLAVSVAGLISLYFIFKH